MLFIITQLNTRPSLLLLWPGVALLLEDAILYMFTFVPRKGPLHSPLERTKTSRPEKQQVLSNHQSIFRSWTHIRPRNDRHEN
jgi:hypothetical protein